MTEQNKNQSQDKYGRTVTGLFFVIIGLLLLAHKMGLAFMPDWLFTWPSILIAVGLYTGVKHQFKNFGWIIMVGIGTIFLVSQQVPGLNLEQYTLPIIFIGIGLLFITRPRHKWNREEWKNKNKWKDEWKDQWKLQNETANINYGDGEYIEVNSVFGGAKKNVFSKNFKGGEINCFMGGAEVNLTQADIQGAVVIEANNVFGGTKLIIPPHWDLKTEATSVFGNVEDKRPQLATVVDTSKVLILKGNCVFGGIEINSY